MAIPFPTKAELEALWNDPDVSVRDIAKKYFVTDTMVRNWAVRHGFAKRADARVRFDQSRDAEFVAMWNEGIPLSVISKTFGVGHTAISNAILRLGLKKRTPVAPPRRQKVVDVVRFDVEPVPEPGDPTPEEIEARKAECDAKRELAEARRMEVARWHC